MLAPIILFAYNRFDHVKQTLEALSNNTLAKDSQLFVFCDGAKENSTQEQIEKINKTREIIKSKQWCGKVTVIENKINKGLATNIIEGVTKIVNEYGSVIVLEDDIVTSKYFLEYMNTALDKYKDEKKVFHIGAYRYPIKKTLPNSSFFYPIMDCWGWATWADRWQFFKKDASYYKSIFTKEMIYKFNMDGADKDKWIQVEDNYNEKLNTWAIFWGASIFVNNGLCLSPSKSLVKNIGFDNSGEHCSPNPYLQIKDINTKIEHFPTIIDCDGNEYNKNKKYIKNMYFKQQVIAIIDQTISAIFELTPECIKRPLRKMLKIV